MPSPPPPHATILAHPRAEFTAPKPKSTTITFRQNINRRIPQVEPPPLPWRCHPSPPRTQSPTPAQDHNHPPPHIRPRPRPTARTHPQPKLSSHNSRAAETQDRVQEGPTSATQRRVSSQTSPLPRKHMRWAQGVIVRNPCLAAPSETPGDRNGVANTRRLQVRSVKAQLMPNRVPALRPSSMCDYAVDVRKWREEQAGNTPQHKKNGAAM